ncbi:MAG: fibrobacter succinogenes major paralogous domain-containing protein [Candidatus Kapabacteria bacterium]|nr:fibrobacter succinogenes major paralogous domain-containing protein [Candidatus Kapabacteria bacterium]
MMKYKILIIALLISSITVLGQVPVFKVNLSDGSGKSYNISDIGNILFTNSANDYSMNLYYKGLVSQSLPTSVIDSISFEKTNNIIAQLIVYIKGSTPKNLTLSNIDSIVFNSENSANPPSVKIGKQIWMLRNLNVSKYRNGDPIPEVTDGAAWLALSTGARCSYNNDPSNDGTYGKLYNWYAINDSRGIAPLGWHVASEAEWDTLAQGGISIAGGALKEAGTSHWVIPNTGATNLSGFTGLPGGYRLGNGTYQRLTQIGGFWTSTINDETSSFVFNLVFNTISLSKNPQFNGTGFSVRCVKD